MSETSLEALQKKAKNAYLLAIFLSAALFFAIISVLFFQAEEHLRTKRQ